ncbi:restriction endonuclease subunit S [Bifidobacterium catenulatum]|uniref:restriction endonuclease subunit S n=1 Tax=Bifidobacterium catenulatum TaxID=1686 RepID=UPI003F93B28D
MAEQHGKALVPQIRFAGFTDPWEQRKLGEFGSVAMCKRIYKEQTSEQGDVPFFKIGTFGANPDAFISNELFEDFKCIYPYPTPGTLLISAAGSIGRVVEYQGEKAYFQDSNIVWLEHDHRLNDAFLKPLYSRIEWGLEGSTIKRLYNKDLLSAEVTVPGGREQKEIGQFFAKLDNLITLHQRKYDKLCVLKKSMLDKMFPKGGSLYPEIRFAGFTDPWEQRKLGEFGSVAMCKRIYKEQTSEQGDVPFFKIGTFGANPDAFISNELFEDFKCIYPYPTPGTLLISAAGSIGRVVEYQGEKAYFQDSNIVWLEHDHRLNDAFLKPLYSRIEWGLEGSTIKRLYNKDLLSAEVTVPGGREQKEIGQFFAKLDNLITLHQRKLELLRNIKKSMLDKMFV